MEKPSSLIRQAADERARLIQLVVGLSEVQSNYKPNDQTWSTNQYLEHLVLAEMSGVSKIWSAAESVRKGKPIWQGEHTNRGLSIEEVVARTWKSKEVAPPLVAPRFGGPASYWVENLRLSQHLLERLEPVLEGLPIERSRRKAKPSLLEIRIVSARRQAAWSMWGTSQSSVCWMALTLQQGEPR